VTFNFHQKELIWTMLEDRLEALSLAGETEVLTKLHAAMEREEGEERQGIFVKNIENVQGDERDVIIFSIGYARDPFGKMVAHFGLLNQRGGGNRLNVAISRAKKKGIIVCSIEPEELKVDNALHDGPRLLRSYLQYARAISRGELSIAQQILVGLNNANPESGQEFGKGANVLAEQLEKLLISKGLKVVRQIGDTNFKLDLAIVDADENFLLGIECEGRNYFSGKTAKEREVYRPMALKSRGWKVYRVWARNFFLNPDAELEKIMNETRA
jgi:very-short-patch-repair endonuclease